MRVRQSMYGVYYHDVAILFDGVGSHYFDHSSNYQLESCPCFAELDRVFTCGGRDFLYRRCAICRRIRNHRLCRGNHGVVRVRGDDA